MSVKIQLLTLEELKGGRRYIKVDGRGNVYSHADDGLFFATFHSDGDHYIPADAIEFLPPDPDKALIEGWCRSLTNPNGDMRLQDSKGPTPWHLNCRLAWDMANSFLDYQRKQEGKR